MRCPCCQRPMLALFTTFVCEHCDGAPHGEFYRGWVIWPARPHGLVETWVFHSRDDARRWIKRRVDGTIRAVLSDRPFTWTRSRGTLKDVELADRPFEIFPDHRHPPGLHRAFLAPPDAPDGEQVRLSRSSRPS